jgi:hypothetical protein
LLFSWQSMSLSKNHIIQLGCKSFPSFPHPMSSIEHPFRFRSREVFCAGELPIETECLAAR